MEIYSAITSSKAMLLLPLEPAFTHEKITTEFVKDHVVLCKGPSWNNAQIISLSGIRGTLNDEISTFRSTIHPSSKLFQDLLKPATKTSTLSLLPPLPTSLPDISPPPYPQFIVPSYAPSLVLPPRSQPVTKPPWPPRHNNCTAVANNTGPSRLTNTFVSLFVVIIMSSHRIRQFVLLHQHLSIVSTRHKTLMLLLRFLASLLIVRKDIGREMNKIAELRTALNASPSLGNIPLPSWIIERVQDMTATWYPFIKAPSNAPLKKKAGSEKETSSIGYLTQTVSIEIFKGTPSESQRTKESSLIIIEITDGDDNHNITYSRLTFYHDRVYPFPFRLHPHPHPLSFRFDKNPIAPTLISSAKHK